MWTEDTGGALNTLDINYDQTSSVLVLSDPDDGVISTTTIVPGRTVLVEDVTVNGTTELSALGFSARAPTTPHKKGKFCGHSKLNQRRSRRFQGR